MEINGEILKEYLIDRSILSNNNYVIEEIESYENRYALPSSKFICFSINYGDWYTESFEINYETYKKFLIKKREQKIKKIINGI